MNAALSAARASPGTSPVVRYSAATGSVVFFLFFCEMTDWHAWPLVEHRPTPQGLLLFLGQTMIGTITLIQVTALTIASGRQCAAVLREMDREDDELDPLKSASVRDLRFQNGGKGPVNDGETPNHGR